MDFNEIKKKIQTGDLKTAAKMIGISSNNAAQVINRPTSKHFLNLLTALDKIITTRQEMISVERKKKSRKSK